MRRDHLRTTFRTAALTVAVGAALAACGSGSGEGASPSESSGESSAAVSTALVAADVPSGLTVTTVPSDTAMLSALQSVQQVESAQIAPAGCKTKSVAAQQEVADTVKFGVQQNLAKGEQVLYGVNFLPGTASVAVFEAAGTGECASITYGDVKQDTERRALPAGVDGQGFVLQSTRSAGEQKARSATAYFTKKDVTAMVFANATADGGYDEAVFSDLVRRVAAKI